MTSQTRIQLPKTAVLGPQVAALAPFYKDATWIGMPGRANIALPAQTTMSLIEEHDMELAR